MRLSEQQPCASRRSWVVEDRNPTLSGKPEICSPQIGAELAEPTAGCSKRSSSKAAANEEARRTLCGTLSLRERRERRWKPFSTSCHDFGAAEAAKRD